MVWIARDICIALGERIRELRQARGQCEERGRGHVGDDQYTAVNKAEGGVEFGQTVTVYYDGQDPQVSALEDFSEQSRHDLRFVYIPGAVLAAVVALVLWGRAPSGETSDTQAS